MRCKPRQGRKPMKAIALILAMLLVTHGDQVID
jgi:hypothetical protein